MSKTSMTKVIVEYNSFQDRLKDLASLKTDKFASNIYHLNEHFVQFAQITTANQISALTICTFQNLTLYSTNFAFGRTITDGKGKLCNLDLWSVVRDNLPENQILKQDFWTTTDLHDAFEISKCDMPYCGVSDKMSPKATAVNDIPAVTVNSSLSKQTYEVDFQHETNAYIKTNVAKHERTSRESPRDCTTFDHQKNNLQSKQSTQDESAFVATKERIKGERTKLYCTFNSQKTFRKTTGRSQHDSTDEEKENQLEMGNGQLFKMAHQVTESNSFETVDTVNSRNKYLENSDLLNGNLKTVHNKKQTDNFKHFEAKCCCCAFEICQEVLANNKSELEKNVFDLKEMILDLKDEIMKMKNLLEQKNKIPMVTYSEDPLNCQIARENVSIRNECKRSHDNVSHQIRNDSTQVCSTDFMTGTRSTKIQLNNMCEDDTGLKAVHNTSTVGRNTELVTSSRGRCTVINPSIPSTECLFSSETIFRDDEEPELTLDCLKLPDPTPCLRNETDAKSLINLEDKCSKTLAGNTDNNFGIPEQTISSGYPMSSASSKEMTSAGSGLFEKVSFERGLELPLSVTATNCYCNDENLDVPEMDNQSSVSPASFYQASTCCESINPATNSTLPTFLKSINLEEIEIDASRKKTTSNLQIEDALPSFLRCANDCSGKQFSDNVFDYVNLKQYEATTEYQEPDENSSDTIPQSTKQAEGKTVNKFDAPCQLIRLEETRLYFIPTQGKNENFLGCLFKQSDPVFHNIHVEVLVVGNDGILRQVDPLTELFTSQDFCAEKERSFSETVCELNEESVNFNSIETEVVPNGENVPDLSIADDEVKENAFSESNISPSNKDGIEDINKDCITDVNNIQNHCSPTERKSKKNHMKKKRKKQIGKSYNKRTLPAPESTSLSSLNHSTERPVSDQRATFLKRRSSKQSTFFSSSYTREEKSCSAALHLAIYDSGFGSRTQSLEGYKSELLNEISRETFSLSKIAAGRYGETFELKHSVHCSKQQKSKTGVKIKVFASKLRNLRKTYGKQMRSFFKDKEVQTLESIVRELHIEHRSLKVFGLGSYFDRLNRGESLSVQERMQYEWLRLASFQHYTGNGNALSLARNGFYHDPTDGPTSTRCYLCEARHSTWEYFDNIEVEHRRQSPDCPFHSNRSEESTNISINYETPSHSHRAPPTSTPSVQSTVSSSGTASTGSASLSQTQTSSQNIYQPQENDENSQHSLLALPNSRSYPALGRSGETAYSHLTIPPRRNNIIPGASSINASLDGFASSVPTSTATNTVFSSVPTNAATNNVSSSVPTSTATSTSSLSIQQSAIPSRPIAAGAFGGFNAPTSTSISTSSSTTSTSTSQSVSAPAVAASSSLQRPSQTPIGGGGLKAAISSHLRPSQTPIGGGGRTDPTITVVVENAKHPDYRELDTRINSYQGWPDYLDQTARQMAEAGFFFVGVADFTRCFCCGGGLRNWEPGDDPMLEHTRWFPRCEYVNKLKGERYVAAVQRRHQQHMEEQQRQQQELARNRDANRNPPDPMSTEAAAVLREMGYQQERIKDAILTVRRQIGVPDVTTQQVLAWLLDQHEARSPPTSSRSSPTRDLGVKVNVGLASSSIQTSTQSSVINSTRSASTATSAALTGSSSSVVSSTSTATGAGSQQSGSSTSTTSSTGSTEAGRKPTSQTGSKENGAKEGKSVGKQSAASGGESEEEFKSAEETPSPDIKPSKKKNRKKNKAKPGAKPSDAPNKLNVVDTEALKEENEKLREMQTCKICMERLVNTTLLPCGHLVCCDVCAARLNRCPICRKRIKGTVKTFMS